MYLRRICLSLLILLLVLPAYAGFKRVNTPNPDDLMGVHIYRLDNGLTVYLTENHETPRFYAQIAVRAGSKNDPSDSTGLAHYLEHLLFKGTESMGTLDYEQEKVYIERVTELYEQHFREDDPEKRREIYAEINKVSQKAAEFAIANEIDKIFNSMGGSNVNAHTWHEETVYKVGLPANRITQWAAIEAERFASPVFRLFHTELETVYEEKNRSLDNKDRLIRQAVDALLFKSHPYGQQPTIGSVEHLKRPSIVNIRNYYDTYYVPNNMVIAISGDINIAETIALIDESFSPWERGKLPRRPKWKEKPLDGVERVTVSYEGEEYVLLAFRTAAQGHKDAEALILLDMILDNSVAGLINLNLNQQQVVRRAGSYPYLYNDYGSQQLWGIPKEGQTLEEVEQLLLDQIELIKSGDFEDWIIPAIITDFKKVQKRQLESDVARVSAMTDSFIGNFDWDDTVGEIARMEKVTKSDIVRVANRYFGDSYVAGRRIDEQHEVPEIEKPKIDPIEIDPRRQSEFARRVLDMPYDEIEPVYVVPEKDYKVIDDLGGVTIYYAPNPINDLFSFSINVEFGRHEDATIATATQLLDKSGTGEFTSEDLKKEWYKLGTNFGVGAGDNETYISLSGLDENFEASLALMMQILTKPTADEATLDEMKKIILVQREDAKKNPRAISSALIDFNRYGQDSQYLRLLPSEELNKLTVSQLHDSIRKLLDYERTITYTGSLPLDEFMAILKKHHPIEGDLEEPPPYRFLKARRPDETEIYFFDKEMAQASVRIEFSDLEFSEANHTPVELYNNYFAGGMSGIVFQELREARALAYSAAAVYHSGTRLKDENLVLGVIQSQADKTPEALDAFVDLFDNLPRSPERFAETIDSISSRYRTSKIGYRGVIGAVRGWERLGLSGDPRKARFAQLRAADIQTLFDFHEAHIAGRPKLISIVGDKSKIDMDAIAKTGKIIEITVDQIFVD